MNTLQNNAVDLGFMDTLSSGNTIVHRIDPRAKLIVAFFFIAMVISTGKYEIAALVPFFVYPMVLLAIGKLPARYMIRKIIWVLPFVLMIGICNPLIDRAAAITVGGIGISGGWLSFISLMVRCVLTVSAALILVALTGFNTVCLALSKLGVPKPFVVQLLFLYRYLFVLTEEGIRMDRARSLRSFHGRSMRMQVFVAIIGHLLLRTLERAERMYHAMYARGFDGHIRIIQPMRFGWRDCAFVALWVSFFLVVKYINIPHVVGALVTGGVL